MKCSSCLSALLVGLSVTTATAALAAAPTEIAPPSARLVAQAEPGDVAPAPAPAPADPDGSPAPQPAVSLGTSTTPPAADTPATAAPETEAKPKPRPFAGSAVTLTTSMTTNTVFRGQTQYDNPTVESNLWLLPRYALNDAFQLRGRLIVSYEYTNADSTTYRNEPQLSDTTLQLFYRKIPKFWEIQPAVAVNLGLPTSKSSQAKTLLFSPGLTAQLMRPFEHVLKGDVAVIASLTYSHPFYRSRNPEVSDPRPYALTCIGGNSCSDLLSGSMNASNSLSYSLIVEGEWGKFSPAIMYLGASQWVYHPTDVVNPIDGAPVGRPEGFEPTSVRQTHYLSAWLDYNFNSWLTGEIGYWNSVTAINEGGERSNLIFDRYQDTRVYLGATVQVDNLVKALQGNDTGEGGVVRAKSKPPMFTF